MDMIKSFILMIKKLYAAVGWDEDISIYWENTTSKMGKIHNLLIMYISIMLNMLKLEKLNVKNVMAL